jgi:EAL domain-containing protein (putative c-di-GMP-specific phosphodiesterase class I)/GGDEF domain-containing protein
MTAITVGYVRENNYGQIPLLLWTFVILVILVVLLIAVALLGKKYLSLRKKFRYGEMYDIKTGIYNRSYFMYLFDKKVSMEARPAYYLAHIALDPERMRRCYGQDQADQIAFYTAKALRATVERGEYCARLGDLSFAYLMRCATPEIAEAKIGAFIRKINAENGILREGYQVEFHAGVYHCTRFYEESYRILDVAAETYVRAQRNELPYLFATDDMIHAEDRYGRMQREIIQAIKNGEIQYYLQYVVNIKTSEVCGAEAISRWQHPREGLLMPGDYIPIMQQANIISMLDYYIFEKTCRQLERWGRMPDRRNFFVSCNFDSQTIAEEDFFEKISDIASRYTFDRKKLLLEMTMDTLESDRETAYQNACRCSNAGFSLALDDFGRSFSSISTLLDFPISLLKLDRSFVDLITTERGYRLVEGIVSTARSVGFELLFEGIETEEQCETVKKLGVYYVQGFFFSRVVPQIEADRTLARLFSRLNGKEAEDLFSDPESAAIFDGNLKLFRRVGYSKSFEVMRKQADGSIVELYNEIHHKLMSCMGASSKISMVYETISVGKKPIAKLIFLSNSLIVCLALPPEEYFGTKYPFKDVSYNKKYQSVPFCLKVTDRKSMEDVLELAEVFTKRYAPTIK